MAHCTVPAAEEILDKKFPVLEKGFVRLVDYMGGDQRIVQSARVSYGTGTKSFREDRGLINYLLRNDHTSPFEQVVLTFHVKLPIFVARQWIRHRTARVNEISGRYSVMEPEFYLPPPQAIAFQSADNKQGRDSRPVPTELQEKVRQLLQEDQDRTYRNYRAMIDDNIARELARINLPLSLFTEWYWQIDLRNLFRFLALRMDPHAQVEIREYAKVMLDICKAVSPLACEAFEEHVLDSVRFSKREMAALRATLKGRPGQLEGREQARFDEKLDLNRE